MDDNRLLLRGERILRILLAGAAGAFLLLFFGIALFRMSYPFEFEWMEGGQIDHVLRILRGQKIYVEPSLEFVPFVYNPLYYYTGAALTWILGVGFVPLRLLSLAASAVTFWILFRLVSRETGDPLAGFIAAGFFAATYPMSGGWFDLGRGDSLFLCLLLAGVYVLRFYETDRGALVAGALFCLSFLTKQTAVFPAAALALSVFFDNRRRAVLFAGVSLGVSALAVLVLNAIHDGWYLYTISSAGNVPLEWPMLTGFWTRDLLPQVPAALILAAVGLLRWKPGTAAFRFYLLLSASMLFISWSGRFHNGGFVNVLMTFHLQLAMLIGFSAGRASRPDPQGVADVPAWNAGRRVALCALAAIQFAWMVYSPRQMIPPERDRVAGEQMMRRLREIPGDILVPYHGYYSTLAGKNVHAHIMTMIEVVISGDVDLSKKLTEEIRADIRKQRFAAIVLDRDWFREDVEKYYVKAGKVFENGDVFWPITGYRTRPEWIYLPRTAPIP